MTKTCLIISIEGPRTSEKPIIAPNKGRCDGKGFCCLYRSFSASVKLFLSGITHLPKKK